MFIIYNLIIGNTPLLYAAQMDYCHIVRSLADCKATLKITVSHCTVLLLKINKINYNNIKCLIALHIVISAYSDVPSTCTCSYTTLIHVHTIQC